MPRREGLSFTVATAWGCRSPRATSVRRYVSAWPIPERICFTTSCAPVPAVASAFGFGARLGRGVAFLPPFRPSVLPPAALGTRHLPGPVAQLGRLHAALPRDLSHGHQVLEPVDGRPHHVVRV